MANYTPPNIGNLPFNFGTGGYTAPDFSSLEFSSGLRPVYSQTANLQAAIEVMGLYQSSTYTYLKECRTIVVGYGQNGIQTLQLPCLYGGIRDLGAILNTQPPNVNLLAYIDALANFKDLATFQRANVREDTDLIAVARANIQEQTDLSTFQRAMLGYFSSSFLAYVKVFQGSREPRDLLAYIYDIQPVNLSANLNVIEIRNLYADIIGEWWKGEADLQAEFFKVHLRQQVDLPAPIYGWDAKDLRARVGMWFYEDLPAYLDVWHKRDITSYLQTIPPKDLSANIHGFAYKYLTAYIVGGYGDGDLFAYINAVPQQILKAYIRGYYGTEVPRDLKAYVSGFATSDLQAVIGLIGAANLTAYIDSRGKSAMLYATIYPKTINIKRRLFVPLLEHRDLLATIQYSCRLSGYRDLTASMYFIHRKDLRAYIIGWYGGTADNVKDLKAYINTGDYSTFDTVDIKYIPEYRGFSLFNVYGGKAHSYKTYDTIYVLGGKGGVDLKAYVTAILRSRDLAARITVGSLANYTSVPGGVDPKHREVVINFRRFEQRWRRFVDLMFFTNNQDNDYHYFYVSDTNTAYKVDRSRTWVIWVEGYFNNFSDIVDRTHVRRKFIFNLNKYGTVDEAVRDMIDRVAELRRAELPATITGVLPTHRNLSAEIAASYGFRWTKNLTAYAHGYVQASKTLEATIAGQIYSGQNNLTADIVGKTYEPPPGDAIPFVFDEPGYTPDEDINWTEKQAEDFWKE